MTGCKVNSKMVPIITKLKNGDIIEIITSDSTKGPSRDWLQYVKSTVAKNRIASWFKKADREQNIIKGRELVEKEIKRIGMTQTELFKQDYVNAALKRYKYSSIEDMYAAIGFGANTSSKVISKMLEEYIKEHKDANLEEKIEELKNKKVVKNQSNNGVVVKGIDNCLVKLSKCCNPLPGDEIIGYITKGRGVSIHRKDCVNVNELLNEENRIIDVEWFDENKKTEYTVEIEIFANDRSGLLADIIKEVSVLKTKLIGVNSRANKEKIAITELTIQVENLEELNKAIKALRKVDSVYEVKRKK